MWSIEVGIQRRTDGHNDFVAVNVDVTLTSVAVDVAVAVAVAGDDEFNSCAIVLANEVETERLRPNLRLIS